MTQQAVTAWSWRHAVARSGLPPETRHVLLTLSLKMDETGGSCYPPVSELVDLTGRDKKTVLKHLALAEERGWIAISQHGYKGQRWKRNEYVACWPGRDLTGHRAAEIDAKGGGAVPPPCEDEVVETVPEGGGTGSRKVVEQLHQDKTLPETLPVNSPERAPAREREGLSDENREQDPETGRSALDDPGDGKADTPGTAAFEKRVMRLCSGRGYMAGPWLDWDTSSPGWIGGQFARCSPGERADCERWRDPYLLDIAERGKKPVSLGVFVRDRMWTGLDPTILQRAEKRRRAALGPDERAQPDGWAVCLGPVGMARLFAALLAGPADAAAAARIAGRSFFTDPQLREAWPDVWNWRAMLRQKGGGVFDPRWHGLKPAMRPVPKGSEGLAAWKAEFERRGWPWLATFDEVEVVYLPAGGPEGVGAFEAALRQARDEGSPRAGDAASEAKSNENGQSPQARPGVGPDGPAVRSERSDGEGHEGREAAE